MGGVCSKKKNPDNQNSVHPNIYPQNLHDEEAKKILPDQPSKDSMNKSSLTASPKPKDQLVNDSLNESLEANLNSNYDKPAETFDLSMRCKDVVQSYQQKQKPFEDVDLLERSGGTGWIFKELKTDPVKGIESNSIDQRLLEYGDNTMSLRKAKKFKDHFLDSLREVTIDNPLWWLEGIGGGIPIFCYILGTSMENFKNDKIREVLEEQEEKKKKVKIIRDGKTQEYQISECLLGDLIVLEPGLEIPVDGIVVDGTNLKIDESPMTGEPELMKKATYEYCLSQRKPQMKNPKFAMHQMELSSKIWEYPSMICMSGTRVMQGSGKLIALCIGNNSILGSIRPLLSS